MGVAQDSYARDVGSRQALFREVNERIFELRGLSSAEVVCECSDASCTNTIRVSAAEYHDVRAHSRRFITLPGHVEDAVERVVAEREGYVIVEKLAEAAAAADRLEPRSGIRRLADTKARKSSAG